MDLEVQVAHSITELDKTAWDHLTDGRPFASYGWYRYAEVVRTADKPVYILLSRQGELVAAATFLISWQEAIPISSRMVRNLLARFLHKWPMMICRNPILGASGLMLPEDSRLRRRALESIAREAQAIGSKEKVSFILAPYLESKESKDPAWPADFQAVHMPGPGTCLHIAWPNFDSYLKQLPRSTRKDFRLHRNRAAKRHLQVRRGQTIGPVEQAIRLMRNVERHHGSDPNPSINVIMENASLVDHTWLTVEAEGRLVGCGLTFRDQHSSLLGLLGLDYDVPYVYFQLAYEAIADAIENHSKLLWAGTGAYQFKQSMGFKLTTNNWVAFTGRRLYLKAVGRLLAKMAS